MTSPSPRYSSCRTAPRQTQPLQTYSGLYSGSLPDVANLADADLQGRAQIENGKLTLPDAMEYALTLSTQLDNILIPRDGSRFHQGGPVQKPAADRLGAAHQRR